MAVQDGVDGAAGRYTDIVGQLAQQPVPKLASAPSWLLSPRPDNQRQSTFLNAENLVFLSGERKFVQKSPNIVLLGTPLSPEIH
jgi:hypothetical protein